MPTPNEEERRRIVSDAIKHFNFPKPEEPNDLERLLARAKHAVMQVAAVVRQLEAADEAAGRNHDRRALSHMISKLFADKFVTFSKDELLMLLVVIHTEEAMDSILGGESDKKAINP